MEEERRSSEPVMAVPTTLTPPTAPPIHNHHAYTKRAPGTPKKHVTLPLDDPSHSKDSRGEHRPEPTFCIEDSSPTGSPSVGRRKSHGDDADYKCNPLCPGHRKHSLCERRNGDSPRPHRHHECDGSHRSRSKHREQQKQSHSSHKFHFKELADMVDAAGDGGLGSGRMYHSASHLAVLKNCENDKPNLGMKQRDFSMSHISERKPLTEKELRLMPMKSRSNSSSRSGSPLRTIRHSVRIEKWDKVTDGDLNVENMMKKFDVTGFSHNIINLKPGEIMISEISPEVRKAGLVKGKVWVKMYGRRINLLLGDILEIPANQAHKAAADESEDAILVMGHKEGCCIS